MQTRTAAVAFMDVVGSVQVSFAASPDLYESGFIQPLHSCYRSVLESFGLVSSREGIRIMGDCHPYDKAGDYREMDIRGDQMVVILSSDDTGRDVEIATRIALEASERWLLRSPNVERWRQSMEPLRVVAGVHHGPLVLAQRDFGLRGDSQTAEGFAINYAKRVESHARSGLFTKVMLSENALSRLMTRPSSHFVLGEAKLYDVKGIGNQILREIKFYLSPGVFTPAVKDVYARMFALGVYNIGAALVLLNHMRYAGETGLGITRRLLWDRIHAAVNEHGVVDEYARRKIREYDAQKRAASEMPLESDPVPDDYRAVFPPSGNKQ